MEKLRFSHFEGTMKNEVVPTSAPHKMAGNYFSAKKIFLHTSYACFFHQNNFQTSMTSGSAGLRKNMRDPPPTARFWNSVLYIILLILKT